MLVSFNKDKEARLPGAEYTQGKDKWIRSERKQEASLYRAMEEVLVMTLVFTLSDVEP